MRITVTAKPKKKKEFVEQISPNHYIISVKEPPEQGRANYAIILALAKYFKVSSSEVELVSGHTSKIKTLEIPDRFANFEPVPKQKSLF